MLGLLLLFGGALTIGAVSYLGDEGGDGDDGESGVNREGTEGDDLLVTGSGDDVIDAKDGNDRVFAGRGSDLVLAGPGSDRAGGGAGDDTLLGGAGSDTLYAEDGSDLLSGDAGQDFLNAGPGDDVLSGGDGKDRVYAGLGDDMAYGGESNDFLQGFGGDDTLVGGSNGDVMTGDDGDDYLLGGGPDAPIAVDLTRDELFALNEDGVRDDIVGDRGEDTLLLGAGDLVRGGPDGDSFVIDRGLIPETETETSRIRDFEPGLDTVLIEIPASEADNFTAADAAALQRVTSDGVLIEFDPDLSQPVLLEGLTQVLDEADFRINAA